MIKHATETHPSARSFCMDWASLWRGGSVLREEGACHDRNAAIAKTHLSARPWAVWACRRVAAHWPSQAQGPWRVSQTSAGDHWIVVGFADNHVCLSFILLCFKPPFILFSISEKDELARSGCAMFSQFLLFVADPDGTTICRFQFKLLQVHPCWIGDQDFL